MTRTMEMSQFRARHADGAFVLDVREPAEYLGGHVPGATLAPMSRITSVMHSLPKVETIHVICESGNRSGAMADLLSGLGFDAVSVQGGTKAWTAAGGPVVTGPRPR